MKCEACDTYAANNRTWARSYDSKQLSYWGCGLYPTEAQARRSFG